MFLTPAMYVDVLRKWPWEQLVSGRSRSSTTGVHTKGEHR